MVEINNNRGFTELAEQLGDVADVRVRLCPKGNITVCGAPVEAAHGERRAKASRTEKDASQNETVSG